jgi:hypothetical protein
MGAYIENYIGRIWGIIKVLEQGEFATTVANVGRYFKKTLFKSAAL